MCEWGCLSMKMMSVALTRSVSDYGSTAFGSAAKADVSKLDVCSGAAGRRGNARGLEQETADGKLLGFFIGRCILGERWESTASDPHSGAEGGANAPKRSLPTAINPAEEEAEEEEKRWPQLTLASCCGS